MSIAHGESRTQLTARTLRRACIAFAATAAAMVLLAGPALAHITVTPDSVPAGSTVVLTFHVPNEESKADTVNVDVQIPTNHPIAQLLVQPIPGWKVTVKTITLARPIVTEIRSGAGKAWSQLDARGWAMQETARTHNRRMKHEASRNTD